MQTKVAFSAKRLLLTLLLCSCSVILLQSFDLSPRAGFLFHLICIAVGLAFSFLFFIPSVVIRVRTGFDFPTLVHCESPKLSPFLAVFYGAYFVYTAVFFLLPYTDMFCKKYFPETSPCFVAALLLISCVYAAAKGTNVITRFGIFLFVFALIANVLMMGGSVSSLSFESGVGLNGTADELFRGALYFVTPAFIAVIFGFLSGFTKNFRLRQVVLTLIFTGVKYTAIMFFVCFALGAYAYRQEYQTFVLSRVAHFGIYSGIESVYLALTTMSVFLIVSLFLCCVGKSVGQSGVLKHIICFAAVIFTLHTCAVYLRPVSELLTDTAVMVGFTFIAAVVVPCAYLIFGRVRLDKKAVGA